MMNLHNECVYTINNETSTANDIGTSKGDSNKLT